MSFPTLFTKHNAWPPSHPERATTSQAVRNNAIAIATAAKRLNDLRENWVNPKEWTDRVPEVIPLDMAVAKTYGWSDYTADMPDEEILKRLLALNLERAA